MLCYQLPTLAAVMAYSSMLQPTSAKTQKDIPCLWTSPDKKHTFDLRPLIVPESKQSYWIVDGDIPCTPETEPSFGYTWNFCQNVAPIPEACEKSGKSGVALQYIYVNEKEYDCYVIGKYDAKKDDLSYTLLNAANPSEGIRMIYPSGERCQLSGIMRSATIDVQCADTEAKVVSAYATEMCSYHLLMESYHGCPMSCKVTENGLCNGHGHCAYDDHRKESYCFCDYGYDGDECQVAKKKEGYDGMSVQIGLMSTLLVAAIGMIAGLSYMTFKVMEYRKAQNVGVYNFLTSVEMAQTNNYDETF